MTREFPARPLPPAAPADADRRRAAPPIVCYAVEGLPPPDTERHVALRAGATLVSVHVAPPRGACTFEVPAGHLFRIVCPQGPQVGDLNLWNAHDLRERFWSGKTRQLHATHLGVGQSMWSCLPWLRPMATIVHDTLGWYGWDADGAGVHDVIGTRCDPYTNRLLKGVDYHHCCHSNLSNALAAARGLPLREAETLVHDVLNVFMCTGFTRDTHQYFMKASPVRAGDYLEFVAEIDLLGALSACPGGDCGTSHSDDRVPCHPLHVEVLRPEPQALAGFRPAEPSPFSHESRDRSETAK